MVLDSTTLPEDAEFKGHEDVVVQDIVLGTENVLFHKEKSYSPSQGPQPASFPGWTLACLGIIETIRSRR